MINYDYMTHAKEIEKQKQNISDLKDAILFAKCYYYVAKHLGQQAALNFNRAYFENDKKALNNLVKNMYYQEFEILILKPRIKSDYPKLNLQIIYKNEKIYPQKVY